MYDRAMSGDEQGAEAEVEFALGAIRYLAEEIGPRAPGSDAEENAAFWVEAGLRARGLTPRVEEFPSYRSFGHLYAAIFLLSLLATGRSRLGKFAGLVAVALGFREGRFSSTRALRSLFPRRSRNVWTTIEPSGRLDRTVCLVSHLDSSRSGLMFHPAMRPYLGGTIAAVTAIVGLNAVRAVLGRFACIGRVFRAAIAVALGLVVERELRGEDVPGANDNASGVGVCLALAERLASEPLEHTRVVFLATGAEEAGVLGMRHFLDSRDTREWLFLNFDGVGAAAPLRYLRVEGGPLSPQKADPELVALVEKIGEEVPDLGISACDHGSGLPYDATAVLARGGRALTITAQGETIPNYHWPSDRFENIDPVTLDRTLRLAQEMLAGIDRGEADRT